jgi:hypothetical protein
MKVRIDTVDLHCFVPNDRLKTSFGFQWNFTKVDLPRSLTSRNV